MTLDQTIHALADHGSECTLNDQGQLVVKPSANLPETVRAAVIQHRKRLERKVTLRIEAAELPGFDLHHFYKGDSFRRDIGFFVHGVPIIGGFEYTVAETKGKWVTLTDPTGKRITVNGPILARHLWP